MIRGSSVDSVDKRLWSVYDGMAQYGTKSDSADNEEFAVIQGKICC